MFKILIKRLFNFFGFTIFRNVKNTEYLSNSDNTYNDVFLRARYSPWNTDKDFLKCYNAVEENTLVDNYRLYELFDIISQLRNLEGSIIEIGVWKGGSGCLMAKKLELINSETKLFLADTFSGVVKTTEKDQYYFGGEHNDTSIETVNELLKKELVSSKNVFILSGIFPDETGCHVEDEKFKLCHIDVDSYQSAKDVFNWIWKKMIVSGIIVFDDYGFKSCLGVTEFVNEIKTDADKLFFYNLNGHAIIVKIC